MSDNAKIRRRLMRHAPDRLKKALAKIQCEKCGKYFKVDEIDCHHSVIPVREIIEEYKNGRLEWKDAKKLAKSRENIIVVCKHCHKIIHKTENLCVQQQLSQEQSA